MKLNNKMDPILLTQNFFINKSGSLLIILKGMENYVSGFKSLRVYNIHYIVPITKHKAGNKFI